jgi:hypothetical protein
MTRQLPKGSGQTGSHDHEFRATCQRWPGGGKDIPPAARYPRQDRIVTLDPLGLDCDGVDASHQPGGADMEWMTHRGYRRMISGR